YAVRGHVVMSHDGLQLEGAEELGHDVVLRLGDAAATLMRLDRSCPDAMRPLRSHIMSFLLGLRPRAAAAAPVQIYQYRVDGRPMRRGNATVYGARTPAGELVDLVCVPVDGAAD